MYTISLIKTIQRPWGLECRYTATDKGLPDINRVVPIAGKQDPMDAAAADLLNEQKRLGETAGRQPVSEKSVVEYMRERPSSTMDEFLNDTGKNIDDVRAELQAAWSEVSVLVNTKVDERVR